jgi:hypothetical protein
VLLYKKHLCLQTVGWNSSAGRAAWCPIGWDLCPHSRWSQSPLGPGHCCPSLVYMTPHMTRVHHGPTQHWEDMGVEDSIPAGGSGWEMWLNHNSTLDDPNLMVTSRWRKLPLIWQSLPCIYGWKCRDAFATEDWWHFNIPPALHLWTPFHPSTLYPLMAYSYQSPCWQVNKHRSHLWLMASHPWWSWPSPSYLQTILTRQDAMETVASTKFVCFVLPGQNMKHWDFLVQK